MTLSTSPISTPEPLRIRGLEMPWNRALNSAVDASASTRAARALGPWRPQEFLAECVEVVSEAGGMMTFVFRRADGAPLSFRAGQYLNIEFPVHGPDADPVDRSYSISSAPTQPWTFSITVKRDPQGLVSPWIHDNVRPGMLFDMLGPVGAFHLPDADRRARYLFLAAGAGITPLMSMIRTIHHLPGKVDVVLLYHAAQAGGFAFSQELEYLAATDSRFKVYWSLGDHETPGNWEWMAGRLTARMINEVAPDANGRQVFACGPEGYLGIAEEILPKVGVDDTSINIEYFSGDRQTLREYTEEVAIASEAAEEAFAEGAGEEPGADLYGPDAEYEADGLGEPLDERGLSAVSGLAGDGAAGAGDAGGAAGEVGAAGSAAGSGAGSADAAAGDGDAELDTTEFATVGSGSLTMSFVQSKLNVLIEPDQRILRVAQDAGIRIRANCQEGMCGSCKTVKLEGEVDMHHQGGIRAREIEAGKFLPCCSTPLTDLVIDA
ncbi:MAG: ferredoxin reductase [Leucobacter sp.]